MSKRIFRNLLDLITGTFISRILGFLRELVTAAYYGTNRAMDLFVIAFTIPTFFRHFLGEDVIERAFMPPFKKLITQKKNESAWRLISSCLNIMIFALLSFMVICYFIAPILVKIIAPGLEKEFLPQAIIMTYWILPFMFIIGMAAFVGSILNFFEMNKIYSIAPAMMSVGVIIGVVFFKSTLGIYALPAGFLLGGVIEFLIQVPFLNKREIKINTAAKYYPIIETKESELRKVAHESGFIFFKALLDKSVEIVDRMLASFLIVGSIASLWFAQRLIQLPVAIIGLAISRSLIPYLTEKRALTQDDDFISGIKLGIRLNFALIVPVTMIMIVLAKPIISIVYERGSFDSESTQLTSIAFWCYSTGLLGLSLNAFFSRLFSIFQKNKIPFYISIVSSVLNIILNFILVKTSLKHGGIALSSSIAFTVSCFLLFYFLYQEIDKKIKVSEILKEFMNIFLGCLIIGILVHYLHVKFLQTFVAQFVHSNFIQNLIILVTISLLAIVLYFSYMFTFGPEIVKNRLFQFLHVTKRLNG